MSIFLILLIVALILFLAAAFNVPSKVGLVALGLALVVLAFIINSGAIRA